MTVASAVLSCLRRCVCLLVQVLITRCSFVGNHADKAGGLGVWWAAQVKLYTRVASLDGPQPSQTAGDFHMTSLLAAKHLTRNTWTRNRKCITLGMLQANQNAQERRHSSCLFKASTARPALAVQHTRSDDITILASACACRPLSTPVCLRATMPLMRVAL
jgi:hypothetical protein